MPNHLQKSLQCYLSKTKKSTPQQEDQSPSTSRTLSSSTSWILRGCKHPKTPSFCFDHNKESDIDAVGSATLSDIDRFLVENFKSLYKKKEDEEDSSEIKRSDDSKHEEKPIGILFDQSPRSMDHPPVIDLSGSHRFFVATASSSGSLIEEARTSLTTRRFEELSSSSTTITSTNNGRINDSTRRTSDDDDNDHEENLLLNPEDFITVLKYSLRPYDDFKKSMHEMVDARLHHNNGKVDWEFMEELLFCYLNLNDKKSYRFILRAFVDIIIVLRENSGSVPAKPRSAHSDCGRMRRN